jgi:hypothetical protein
MCGQLNALAILHPPRGNSPRYPWDMMLGGAHSGSRRYGEDSLTLPGIESCFFSRPARPAVTIGTGVFRTTLWRRRSKASIDIAVFWVMTPCVVVNDHLWFGLTYCVHLKGETIALKMAAVYSTRKLTPTYRSIVCHHQDDHSKITV